MTEFEEERIDIIKRGIEYNIEKLGFTHSDVAIWLEGIRFIESYASEEYFQALENLKEIYMGGVF